MQWGKIFDFGMFGHLKRRKDIDISCITKRNFHSEVSKILADFMSDWCTPGPTLFRNN